MHSPRRGFGQLRPTADGKHEAPRLIPVQEGRTPRSPPRATSLAGVLAVAVGVLALFGWALDIAALKSVVPGRVTLKPNTALAFVLSGIALLLLASPFRSRLARVPTILAGLIGLLTLMEYAFHWNLGIDQWLFTEPVGTSGTSHPGRMAPDTALCFVMSSGAIWLSGRAIATRRAAIAAEILGSLVIAVALASIFAFLSPGLRTFGWWGGTVMSPLTAIVFVITIVSILLFLRRGDAISETSNFSINLRATVACIVALVIFFLLYGRSEVAVIRANEMRYRSYEIADQMRQSGDDLTRMARTYVVTGDPVYKEHFQEILDIRNGKKPRPENYGRPYWDLILPGRSAPPNRGVAVPLLEIMQQAGFTDEEFRKLDEAKSNSDGLTIPEFEAMKLIESAGPNDEADRARARAMMHDEKYHRAKASVMGPIRDFIEMVDKRTLANVREAEESAARYQQLFAASGIILLFFLFRTYRALDQTLGGAVDQVYAQIRRIGHGDFAAATPVKAGLENSVMGWLAETQHALKMIDGERRQANEEILRLNSNLEERVRARTAELENANSISERHRAMISAIMDIQSRFISAASSKEIYDGLLKHLLTLTGSEYGFIDEMLYSADGRMYLTARAITNIAWSDETQKMYAQFISGELNFTNLKSLFGAVMTTGKPVIANDAPNDPRRTGIPSGHPALTHFLGLPLHSGGEFVGVIGLANGPGGYSEATIAYLDPMVQVCANIIAAMRNDQRRQQAEESLRTANSNLEVTSRELEAFSYSVAHDLRAPLRGMNGFATVLLNDYHDKFNADGRDCLEEIHSNAKKMGDLIDALLSLSRVTRSELRRESVDLSDVARTAVSGLAAASPARSVEVVIQNDLHGDIDPVLARALVENLLGNAWKFTMNEPKPKIEFGSVDHDGSPAFFVRDNGAGFDMAHASKLFSPFQRFHTVAEFPGTGIGLANAQRIVRRHGGEIWAESSVDAGATFFFTLNKTSSGGTT